ncbi:MAG: DUF1292 domain-containing protein [Bacilli bacterium]|nr:DUF1292 domain-containing protein [Bacilli bacterium]MDY6391935.1 DUF1292 domain-containing protein [Bacilli bacterium]
MIEIKNDNDMVITADDGSERLLKILFYFHNDQRNKDYYFLYEEGNEDEVIVMGTADGESLSTLTDEEFDEAEQVFEAYENDPTIQTLKEGD